MSRTLAFGRHKALQLRTRREGGDGAMAFGDLGWTRAGGQETQHVERRATRREHMMPGELPVVWKSAHVTCFFKRIGLVFALRVVQRVVVGIMLRVR